MAKRINVSLAAALCLMGLASSVFGQTPKAGNENDDLGFLVGKWNYNGKLTSHPEFPNATVTGTMNCTWLEGHYAVLCQMSQKSDAAGIPTRALRIFAYSNSAHAYTSWGVMNNHEVASDVSLGHFQNGSLSYSGSQKLTNGQMAESKENITKISTNSFKISQESGGHEVAAATFTKAR